MVNFLGSWLKQSWLFYFLVELTPPETCFSDSEVVKWDNLRDKLLSGSFSKKQPSVVEHNCGQVGWGNAFRGLFATASIALALDRNLIISSDHYHKMFQIPFKVIVANGYWLSNDEYIWHVWTSGFFTIEAEKFTGNIQQKRILQVWRACATTREICSIYPGFGQECFCSISERCSVCWNLWTGS